MFDVAEINTSYLTKYIPAFIRIILCNYRELRINEFHLYSDHYSGCHKGRLENFFLLRFNPNLCTL